jgi:septal ring factor EnvC (AmiA/AmiB activator)
MNLIQPIRNKITLLAIVALLAISAAGNFWLFQSKSQLQSELSQKTEQINSLNKNMSQSTKNEEDLKKKISTAENQCKAETDGLKDRLAAFAKQAAACDKLKKKLHVKD